MLPFNIRFLVTAGVTGIYSWAAALALKLSLNSGLPDWSQKITLLVLLPGFLIAPFLAWRWISRQRYGPHDGPTDAKDPLRG